jgi:putative hydrolase of the HAD superfamily
VTGVFEDVEAWVFDLDNTLYPARCGLFDQVRQRMGLYLAETLGLSPDAARQEQRRLFLLHGTTMRGLMVEHGQDPLPFLDYVHDVDLSLAPLDATLDRALEALPGRKFVFTNASAGFATRVLDRIGIARHVEDIFDIVAAGFVPKPDIGTFRTMIPHFGIDPARSAMVEDMAANLAPARALGMKTVLIRSDPAEPPPDPAPDAVADDLTTWLAALTARRAAA